MHTHGNVLGQSLLQDALLGGFGLLLLKRFYLLLGEEGEDAYVASCVDVGAVEPELIELVGGSLLKIEPYIAAFGLAKLGTVSLGDQRTGECKSLAAFHTADELGASGDVAPLVGATHLELAALGAVEGEEIVALEELVAELSEGNACLHALLYAILSHHVVDSDMLTDIADEIEEEVVFHPVIVVAYLGSVDGVVKIEEAFELMLDTLHVVLNFLDGEEFAFLGLEGGVADHARGAADDSEGLVTRHLEVFEEHDGDEVTDMQGVGRGVDADVGRCHFFIELLFGAGHDVVDHAAPFEFLNEVCVHLYNIYCIH